MIKIKTPISDEVIKSLKAGDEILLSGIIYTARDAAHKRMFEADTPPFSYDGNIVFYAGPCPTPPGKPIGSIGPTTAGRMDFYSPKLIEQGLKIMLAKGDRSKAVYDAIALHGGLYLVALGGVAALMAKCVVFGEVVAYNDLGTEAIRRLEVVDMPLIAAIDSMGRSVYGTSTCKAF